MKVHPTDEGLKAVRDLLSLKNINQLWSSLSLANYFRISIPNLNQIKFPLTKLIKGNSKTNKKYINNWETNYENSFRDFKKNSLPQEF